MATARELVQELSASVGELESQKSRVTEDIGRISDEIADLSRQRADAIRATAIRLLPDLRPETVRAILARQLAFLTPDQVAQALVDAAKAVSDQIDRLKERFDPGSYDQARAKLEIKAASDKSELEQIFQPEFANFERLGSFDAIARLIADGYGTGAYQSRWYNRQYYVDWREADQAVEEAKYSDWDSLKSAFVTARDNLAAAKAGYEKSKNDLASLESLKRRHDQLQDELAKVPAKTLESLQTKLIGELSGLDPVPAWMLSVAGASERLAKLESQKASLGEVRAQMTKDISQLVSLKSKASGSRRNVPDQYIEQIRTSRQRFSSGGGIGRSGGFGYQPAAQVVVYDNSSFLDGVIYAEMMGCFDGGHHHGGYSGGGGYGGGGGSGGWGEQPSSRFSSVDSTMQS